MRSSSRDGGEILERPSISIARRTHGNKQLFMLTFKQFRTKSETNPHILSHKMALTTVPLCSPIIPHHRSHVLQLIAVTRPCLGSGGVINPQNRANIIYNDYASYGNRLKLGVKRETRMHSNVFTGPFWKTVQSRVTLRKAV